MQGEIRMIAETLKVMANEHRLHILCELINGPRTVNALVAAVGQITQPALSQHLALLKAHGIVTWEKNGQSVTYSIADHRVEAIISALKHSYCDWEATAPPPRTDESPV